MWFILIPFQGNVSGVLKFDDYNLDVCRGRCLRIIRNNKVRLDQTERTCLTRLASYYPNKLHILCDDLKQWQDNVSDCKEFCAPRSTNFNDCETLYDELLCKKY
jgi:hypothetical protein